MIKKVIGAIPYLAYVCVLSSLLAPLEFVRGQDSLQQDIATQRVVITKSYQATLLGAEKLFNDINISDSLIGAQKKFTYEILDFPFLSVYEPVKPVASRLVKNSIEISDNNIIGVGLWY